MSWAINIGYLDPGRAQRGLVPRGERELADQDQNARKSMKKATTTTGDYSIPQESGIPFISQGAFHVSARSTLFGRNVLAGRYAV